MEKQALFLFVLLFEGLPNRYLNLIEGISFFHMPGRKTNANKCRHLTTPECSKTPLNR